MNRRLAKARIARAVAVAVVTTAALGVLGSCGAGKSIHRVLGAAAYWTRSRLLGARPFGARPVLSGTPIASTRQPSLQASRVGAIFSSGSDGNHFCTASVVASSKKDLLITAAHCISGGKSGGYQQNIVFIPGYRDGSEPYGVWTPAKLLVAPQWSQSSDPDYDVGFVILNPSGGKSIQDVLGANQLAFNPDYHQLVRVTGYPDTADSPVACQNWTTKQSPTQLRFDCGGFYDGTSGSPFVTRFNPFTLTGTIIGVIGGYQEGGDTPSISYSSYFGSGIKQLYEQAVAAS